MAANAARCHLVDLSMSWGWDEIEGVEGSLRGFLLERKQAHQGELLSFRKHGWT